MRNRVFAFLIMLCGVGGMSTLAANEPAVDFAKHIAPIVHTKCAICHRKGQPGPFELITFDDVRDRAETIQAVVHDNYMPPWKPINENIQFANDRRLTTEERRLFDDWISTGMAAGDLQSIDLPDFPSDWSLGKPDLVLKMKGRFEVPASGPDIYRSFLFPTSLEEDKWVKAIELRPTARGAVHHALFFVDTTGEARSRDGRDGKVGLSGMSFLRAGRSRSGETAAILGLGGYVPGAMPNKLPGDLALYLPKDGDIVMQTHFHPSGKTEWEEAELALYFADKPPSRQIVPIQLPPLFGRFAGIDVPAGESDYEVKQTFQLPVDVEAVQIGGHAHYICREMELHAELPSGETLELLTIDDWDLDWQDQYQFQTPLDLPKGTDLHVRLLYDNSADNPENPYSPPQRIKWGRESTDEMGSVTLQVVTKTESDRETLLEANREFVVGSIREQFSSRIGQLRGSFRSMSFDGRLVESLDRNKDGNLQRAEIPARIRQRILDFADSDGDGNVDAVEIQSALKRLRKAPK